MSYLPDNYGLAPVGATGLTASGTSQATALLLPAEYNEFSTVASGTSCVLPVAQATITIINNGANALLLYPPKGDRIDALGVDNPASIGAGGQLTISQLAPILTASPRTWRTTDNSISNGGTIAGNLAVLGTLNVTGVFTFNSGTINVTPTTTPLVISGNLIPPSSFIATTALEIIGANSSNVRISADAFNGGVGFSGRRANGTSDAPTALAVNNPINSVSAFGYGLTAYSLSRANFGMFAAEAWTDAAQGTYQSWSTVAKLSTTLSERMRLHDTGALAIGQTTDDGIHALQVTGGISATTGYISESTGNALTAIGTNRATALALTNQVNNVTTAAAGTGVILPSIAVCGIGTEICIFSAGANAIQVYGAGSDTVDTVAAATGVPLTNTKRCIYKAVAAATWISAQLGVVSA